MVLLWLNNVHSDRKRAENKCLSLKLSGRIYVWGLEAVLMKRKVEDHQASFMTG